MQKRVCVCVCMRICICDVTYRERPMVCKCIQFQFLKARYAVAAVPAVIGSVAACLTS